MENKMDVAIGVAVGVILGVVGVGTLNNSSFSPGPRWAHGTCTKEFGPEARAKGYSVPANPDAVTLTRDLKAGTCTAEFPDGKGGQTTFTWDANKGTHVPASVAPAASAVPAPKP